MGEFGYWSFFHRFLFYYRFRGGFWLGCGGGRWCNCHRFGDSADVFRVLDSLVLVFHAEFYWWVHVWIL